MKGLPIFYKKMKKYFQKIFLKDLRPNFRKKIVIAKNAYYSLIINSRIIGRISDERVCHSLQETEAIFSKKMFFKNFSLDLKKN